MLKPQEPLPPKKPRKTNSDVVRDIKIWNNDSLSKILELIKPEDYDKFRFNLGFEKDMEDPDSYFTDCHLECYDETENLNYEAELALYEYLYERYVKDLGEYHIKIKEYEEYCKLEIEKEIEIYKNHEIKRNNNEQTNGTPEACRTK